MQQTQHHLIGSAETAALLGRSQRTVQRMVKAGELTPAMTVRGGYVGTWLFDRAEVERVKAEREQASA